MTSKFASGAFSALIYCQALLVFAGVASVVLRDRPETAGHQRHAQLLTCAVVIDRL